MTNAVLLDNVTHADLRVRTEYSAEFGDSINLAMVFPTEFAFVQREYPILLRPDSNGEFQAFAMMGLDKGENLFLEDSRWKARYVPAVQQRGPFLIGLHRGGAGDNEPKVHVNLDHPRISQSGGEPVFLPHGGNSPYLEHVSRMLEIIYHGTERAKPMFAAFEKEGLLESMEAEIKLGDGLSYKLSDFYTINQERFESLDGDALERLNRDGYLQLAVMLMHSLGNMQWIIELKKRKLAAGA